MKSINEFIKRSLIFPIRNAFIHVNRLGGRFNRKVWIIGDGRSGTTWLLDLLNTNRKLELFEPFHPYVMPDSLNYKALHYAHSLPTNHALVNYFKDVFNAKLMHRRVHFNNRSLLYTDLIVKDVFASLIAPAILPHLENVKVIVIMRNPIDVIKSKLTTGARSWYWGEDLEHLADNIELAKLLTNKQKQHLKSISEAGTVAQKYALIWCLNYFILFQCLAPRSYFLLKYENLLASPEETLLSINEFLGEGSGANWVNMTKARLRIAQKSRTDISRAFAKTKKIPNRSTIPEEEVTFISGLLDDFYLQEHYPNLNSMT